MAAIESLCMFITFVASSLGTNPPETDMTTIEIIAYHGYTAEVINVKTEDGYILQMHRIPYAKNESIHTLNRKRPVVFLQHGLLGSSADWVLNHPNQTSAFLFADAGFDVWMGNMRGNVYSTQHETYPRNTKEYWQFSWDEMSKYDLEAMIDKVLNITKQPYVHYVGHSQGTLIMFTKLASDQKFATKIRKFFALAPVGACSHIEGLFSVLGGIVKKLPSISVIFGDKEFLPDVWVMKLFSKYICGFKDINPLCNSILFLIGGPENQFDQSRTPVYMAHIPAGTSTQNMMHWSQMYNSGETQAYNYGSEPENQKHYGQVTPPFYNLSRVNALTYLYWSDKDWLADEKDIKASLLGRIPAQYIKQNNKLVNFNHLDFLWGKRAADEIYKPIIDSITSYERSQGHLYG